MPVTWDDSADKQMLLCMIHTNSPTINNYEQIATMMGEEYTVESIKQRFKRVKAKAKEQYGEPRVMRAGGGDGDATAPATPAKRGGKKAEGEGGTKSAGKRKSKKTESAGEDDGGSPTKKAKAEAEVKGEEVEDEA